MGLTLRLEHLRSDVPAVGTDKLLYGESDGDRMLLVQLVEMLDVSFG